MNEMMYVLKEIAKAGVEHSANKGLQMSADEVRKLSEAVQNSVNDARFQGEDVKTALERRPAQVARDVARRFMAADSNVSAEKWADSDLAGRKKMLGDAARIIAEELHIPRFKLEIMDAPRSLRGRVNAFIEKNADGRLVVSEGVSPTVEINRDLLKKDSFFDPLTTLFHESLHVMQQYACTEQGSTVLHLPQRELWRREYSELADKGLTIEEYYTSSTEEYAHAYSHYMAKVYQELLADEKVRSMEYAAHQVNREASAVLSPDGCSRLDIVGRSAHEAALLAEGRGLHQVNRETNAVLSPDGCSRLDVVGRSAHDVAFRGGLSASQGISMLAHSKTEEARRLLRKADFLRSKGLTFEEKKVEDEARKVMREAEKYHRQYRNLQIRAEQEKQRHRAEAEARTARDKARREAKEAERARIKAMRIAEEKAKAAK